MRGAEPSGLAEARVIRPSDDGRLLRGLTLAVAIGVVAAVALRSRLAAIIVAVIAALSGGLRLFHHVLERDAEQTAQPEETPAAGDREYPYRPRALLAVVLAGSLLVCGLVIVSPGFAWLSLLAGIVAAMAILAFVSAALLRQRILVTDTHVIVPRSSWSREEVSIPLSDVQVSVWGTEENPSVEISTFDGERDFSMSFLGETKFRDLVRVLEQRSAAARAQLAERPSLDDGTDAGGA